ncbi:MAG: GNAT family N-acetyltransferase [bacterium]
MTSPIAALSPASRAFVRATEERARRAWPALEEESLEGWLLRFAAGATRRSNSVHPVGDVRDVTAALAECTRRYLLRGLVPRLHLHAAVCPTGLDDALAAAGWERELEACVHVADLEGIGGSAEPRGADVRILRSPEPPWVDPFARWRGLGGEPRARHVAILERDAPARGFAVVSERGLPRAVGLAVADEGWVGLFDIVTDPAARRRGFARVLVRGLLDWGREQGARRAYLQVEATNAPALALYAAFGFREAYRYWYRRPGTA